MTLIPKQLNEFVDCYINKGMGSVSEYIYMYIIGEITKCTTPEYHSNLTYILPSDFKFSYKFIDYINEDKNDHILLGFNNNSILIRNKEYLNSYGAGYPPYYGNMYHINETEFGDLLYLGESVDDGVVNFKCNGGKYLISDLPLRSDMTLLESNNQLFKCENFELYYVNSSNAIYYVEVK